MGPISNPSGDDLAIIIEDAVPFAEGMEGRIFRAISPKSETPLALKAFTSFKPYRNSKESPLEEEYQIADDLAHPNIVKVHRDKSSRLTTPFSSDASASASPLPSPTTPVDFSKNLNGFLIMEMISGLNLDDVKSFKSEGEKLSVALDFISIHEHLLSKGYWNFDLTCVNFMLKESSLIAIDIGCFTKIPLEIARESASIFDVSMILHEILVKRPNSAIRGWDHSITKLFSDYRTPLYQSNVTQMQEFLDTAKSWIMKKKESF